MNRSRYEEYRKLLFALQQRVPEHAGDEYEPALIALVNARYHDANRHFRWLRFAERQLLAAEQALAVIDGVVPRIAPARQVRPPVVRWLAVAAAGMALL